MWLIGRARVQVEAFEVSLQGLKTFTHVTDRKRLSALKSGARDRAADESEVQKRSPAPLIGSPSLVVFL
jgi:hypothetical protein